MYQMTLFFKKVICKNNNCLISYTHQKISNCTIFKIFLEVACPQTPLAKGMASIMWVYMCSIYCFHTCKFTFQKKNLDPLSNSVYSPDIHVQMN